MGASETISPGRQGQGQRVAQGCQPHPCPGVEHMWPKPFPPRALTGYSCHGAGCQAPKTGWPQPHRQGVHSGGPQVSADCAFRGDAGWHSCAQQGACVTLHPSKWRLGISDGAHSRSRWGGEDRQTPGLACPTPRPRCSRNFGGIGTAGAWAKSCRRSGAPATTRPHLRLAEAFLARSCSLGGVVAARTHLRRSPWLVTSLGWLRAPSQPRWDPS